ncbi:MAG: dipeptidase [Tissierellaceae bacterium]|nr:dipeptidase [Tissierellaceae bacterium]
MNVVDMHCDTILRLMNREDVGLLENDLSVDIKKLQRGNSLAQFFAMWIDLGKEDDPMETCLKMIDRFYIELDKNSDTISLATNYDEIMGNKDNNRISAVLTIEEGGAIKGQLHNLRNFYRLGVRGITLTWNNVNEIGYPNINEEHGQMGLTEFGEAVVQEMNELGMLIDVSHLSDEGFYHVGKLSNKPFIASHSNSRAIKNHRRNLTDPMIKTLSEKGGVMGICFERDFLGDSENARIEDMIRHIRHIRDIGGIDVIALGSDYDGSNPNCEIDNIGEIGKLRDALELNKFSYEEIEKIFYNNALRVIKEVL